MIKYMDLSDFENEKNNFTDFILTLKHALRAATTTYISNR